MTSASYTKNPALGQYYGEKADDVRNLRLRRLPLLDAHLPMARLYSYRDMVYVGLDVDPLAMDDMEHFRDAFAESYAEVVNVGRDAVVPLRRPA